MKLKDFKIYIDPGHGAGDPGHIQNGVVEHDVNVIVGNEVARLLKSWGGVVKVRDVDDPKFKSTSGCLNIAKDSKNWGADIFVSIHCNDLTIPGNSNISGTETFTQRDSLASSYEKDLAQRIQNGVLSTLKTSDRGVKECNYNVFNKQTAFCVLTELAALNNASDANLLKDSSLLDKLSRNIASAIDDFIFVNFHNIQK